MKKEQLRENYLVENKKLEFLRGEGEPLLITACICFASMEGRGLRKIAVGATPLCTVFFPPHVDKLEHLS